MMKRLYLLLAVIGGLWAGGPAKTLAGDQRHTDILPEIVFIAPEAMQSKACRHNGHCMPAKGLYIPEERRIYLRADWSAENFHDLAILLHEFVHHLQIVGKISYPCEVEIELPAYALQETFYRAHNRNPAGHVPTRFTQFTRFSCLTQE